MKITYFLSFQIWGWKIDNLCTLSANITFCTNFRNKKNLKIPKGLSEAINQRQTVQWPNKRTVIYKTLHKKLNIEQRECHFKTATCSTLNWNLSRAFITHLVKKNSFNYLFPIIAYVVECFPKRKFRGHRGRWIYNYLCNQCLSPLKFWVRILLRRGELDTTLKIVSDLRQLGGFLRFTPPIKLTATM